jgi:biopolymer transport protein ExbD
MRRFSQRNSLVTLSDINITPLLDLAFVLLIIFVITTPLLTQSLDLKLPSGGAADKTQLKKSDIRTIEISPTGVYRLEGRPAKIDQIEQELAKAFRANPKLVVNIPADENVPFKYVVAVLERCRRHNIKQFAFRTEVDRRR